jgi:hypothetical protein
MFKQNIDERLSSWAELRASIEFTETPFDDTWIFWKDAPFVPYNHKVDPYHQRGWPSPWEIIVDNHYDDFTKALMIGWSIKLTDRYKNSKIEVRSLVDNVKKEHYNIVLVDEEIAINYKDNGPILVKNIPDSFLLENLVELNWPR